MDTYYVFTYISTCGVKGVDKKKVQETEEIEELQTNPEIPSRERNETDVKTPSPTKDGCRHAKSMF